MATSLASTLERLDYGSDAGCGVMGLHRNVIAGWTTGRTLLPEESGSLIVFDTAAGQAIILPAPVTGMQFEFAVHITGTGTYSVTTDASTSFIGGGVVMHSTTVAQGGLTAVADPTATLAIALDGDTTGRLVGGRFIMTAISSTVWNIGGNLAGVGTLATPF